MLKYAAGSGPAAVMDTNTMLDYASRLDNDASRKNLLLRMNQSLVNPNVKHNQWDDGEERRLVLAMKVYRDADKKALNMAADHFPNRSARSVTDKWKRSLDPEYSSRPFTPQEDEELLNAMRRHGNAIGWKELSEKYFSGRHPHRLMNRWVEIAPDDDILTRSSRQLSSSSYLARNKAVGLSTDDFVVALSRRKRNATDFQR